MTALDYILAGFGRALEVERECGVRTIEIDRALLARAAELAAASAAAASAPVPAAASAPIPAAVPVSAPAAPSSPATSRAPSPSPSPSTSSSPSPSPSTSPSPSSSPSPSPESADGEYDFVFLHDRPLSPEGVTMMAKIVTALGRTPENAPIVFTGPRPRARVFVVLGSGARRQWFPAMRAAPGTWLKADTGEDVLVTNSPEYILRFGVETPAVREIKLRMWRSIKSVLGRVGGVRA